MQSAADVTLQETPCAGALPAPMQAAAAVCAGALGADLRWHAALQGVQGPYRVC
jgi:hypothetical protein